MAVPIVLSLRPEDVVPADLGYELPPGHAQNPFITTPGWVLERWVVAWLSNDAPDVLQLLLPRINAVDIGAALQIWQTLSNCPEFQSELLQIHEKWPESIFRRQIASLHMRILIMVLVHRLFHVDVLHADTGEPLFSVPRFAHPEYQIHEELQESRRLHPWLRPMFTLHPQWIGRRSNWSMMALHTLICSVKRIAQWDPHRTWIVCADGVHRANISHQSLYTRVPFGHDFAAPACLSHKGLYIDPTVALLLPRVATDLTVLVRKKPVWTRFARKRPSHLFQAVLQTGGIGHLCQWRPWRTIEKDNGEQINVQNEFLYSPSIRKSKQSSALMHVREVMFEAYNRWFTKDFSPSTHRQCPVYDAAFVSFENFLLTLFDGMVFNGRVNTDRLTQIQAHKEAFLQHAKEQNHAVPEFTEWRRRTSLYFAPFLCSPILPMDTK